MSIRLEYMAVSDVGCQRPDNEDMAYADGALLRDDMAEGEIELKSGFRGFAVADGMGGHEGGEVASEMVIRAFATFMGDIQAETDESHLLTALKDWAVTANKLVVNTALLRPEVADMGTTFCGLIFSPTKTWLVNVGDSRCYRLRDGVLKQLTTDHSERELTGDPDTPDNILYNFMGRNPAAFISDITVFYPMEGDTYLICSDGLSDLVEEEDLESNASSPLTLLALAKSEGGRDNITAVRIRVS